MSPRKKPPATSTPPKPLTPKQQRYCEEFLVDCNQTKAAERAGYSPRSAKATASELMDDPRIQAEIARLQLLRAERTQITADQVVRELAIVAFSDIGDYASWGAEAFRLDFKLNASDKIDPAKRRAIESVTERVGRGSVQRGIKLHGKVAALEQLGRHFGIFKDKTEVSMSRETILALMTQIAGAIERVIPDPVLLEKIEGALRALAGKE